MSVLLKNSRGSDGSSSLNAVCQPSRLTGLGRNVSWRTASEFVLNDVETDHAKGTIISSAYPIRSTYAMIRRVRAPRSPTGPTSAVVVGVASGRAAPVWAGVGAVIGRLP